MGSRTRRTSSFDATKHRRSASKPARAANGRGKPARALPRRKYRAVAETAVVPLTLPVSKSHPNHNKHAEIFSAALTLFQEKGYHGASMQDLADAVGIQKASLYYYIQSKEELLVRVCERGTGAFTQELSAIVASDASAADKLRRALECHLVALCEQLALFTVFLREQKFLGKEKRTQLRGEGKRHAQLLEQILRQGVASGEFRPINVPVTTLALLGMCNWLYEWYSPRGAFPPREIAGMFSEMVLNGLAK
jgi:AcrR family transcriptional regulator